MDLLREVVENDCCIACGACMEACPAKAIQPSHSPYRGAWEVEVVQEDACPDCARWCEQVCPGIVIDITALAQTARVPVPENRRGSIVDSWVGYALPFRDNGVSSSGGVLRAITAHFLEQSIPVICLARRDGDYRASTLHRPEEISLVPGSIYHSVPTHGFIEQIKALQAPAVLIVTPCQLEGIFGWIKHCANDARERLLLTAGIICGWMFTDHTVRSFAHYKGIDENILDVGYRGEDKSGYLKLRTTQGWRRYHRRDFPNEGEHHDFSSACGTAANRLRCRLCENHLNLFSDLCVGDAWLQRCRDEKTSILIARSAAGSDLIRRLESSGELVLSPGKSDDLIEVLAVIHKRQHVEAEDLPRDQ